MDAASKSLSEALRLSFIILKVIMVVVVLAFLGSGFQVVGPDEQALVLRFGKVQAVDADGNVVLQPGLRWVMPYPIDELVKIPGGKSVNLIVNSFWYFQTPDEVLSGKPSPMSSPTLNPITDGYHLCRGEALSDLVGRAAVPARGAVAADSDASDYNIAHSKWQVEYQIKDVARFFKNVYVRDPMPGEVYLDLMTKSVEPLLTSAVEDAVVQAMVYYSIDEVRDANVGPIRRSEQVTDRVRRVAQATLDRIDCGIAVQSVKLSDVAWPRQVNEAFAAFLTASQQRQTQIDQAKTEVAGLANRTGGLVRQIEAQAQAYRAEVVEKARSSAEYFARLLPEYRQRPLLVTQVLYLDALQEVFGSADEKFFLPPGAEGAARELRILLNRDPAKPRTPETQTPK